MIRRGATALLVVLVSGACASGGKLPIYGSWRVTAYQATGASSQSSVQTLAWIGTSASYTAGDARFGVTRCYAPTYTSQSLSPTDFTAEYKVAPSALGLTGESVPVYKVECPKDPSLKMVLIVKGADNVLVPWAGTFFQMERLVTTQRSPSY